MEMEIMPNPNEVMTFYEPVCNLFFKASFNEVYSAISVINTNIEDGVYKNNVPFSDILEALNIGVPIHTRYETPFLLLDDGNPFLTIHLSTMSHELYKCVIIEFTNCVKYKLDGKFMMSCAS